MKIFMLHDVRGFDQNFVPERYKLDSFITDLEFIHGISKILNKILDPHTSFNQLNSLVSSDKIMLTFDDGLKDHLWVAEYLAKKSLYAIFFIPFGVVLEKKFVDSHLIQFLIASKFKDDIKQDLYTLLVKNSFSEKMINSFRVSKWKNNVWSEQDIFITRVIREVFDYSSRKVLLEDLINKYFAQNLENLHKSFYLDSYDIKKILSLGHVIGSHGYNSYNLRNEPEISINSELTKSYDHLCKYSSLPYKCISWPNGGFSDYIDSRATNIGFELGFGTEHRHVCANSNRLNLPRLDATKLGIFV